MRNSQCFDYVFQILALIASVISIVEVGMKDQVRALSLPVFNIVISIVTILTVIITAILLFIKKKPMVAFIVGLIVGHWRSYIISDYRCYRKYYLRGY